MTFDERLAAFKDLVERTLDEVLPAATDRPSVLSAAMRHAVGTGGKRLRPLLCLASAVAAGGRASDAAYPAAAIELLHNYTLVHDDLPAMDDDVERRGQPTVWKKYGEANAILAGDALLTLAFGVAARAPRNAAAIVDALAHYGVGVVRGQVEDVVRAPGAAFDVPYVYEHKTADLFMAAAVMGARAVGADEACVGSLRAFARALGLAFQYEDDLIDGDSPFPRAETERLVSTLTDEALAALGSLPSDASFLRALAARLVGRTA